MAKNTSQLTNEILNSKSMDKWSDKHDESIIEDISLNVFLEQMLEKHGRIKGEVIKDASIDTTYGYQIFQGKKKNPSREILLRLALSFPLTVDETKRMLYYGGVKPLYPRVKRDAYLMFAIHNHFTLMETDYYLQDHGEEVLG